jgi:O-antigen biosynthesis protein
MSGSPATDRTRDLAIVVLTHNRVHLLKQCVENVLRRTSPVTREIVIWDNGSSDATAGYLKTLDDDRIRVARSPENLGMNAYARAIALTTARYFIELDDDMVDAPPQWDLTLLEAFERLPDVGYLASALVDDPDDPGARAMHHHRAAEYVHVKEAGLSLMLGPTGGGCAITSRELYDRAGGFGQRSKEIFWSEDAAYVDAVQAMGYRSATLAELRLLHAGGPRHSKPPAEKVEFWGAYVRRAARKRAVKRLLLRVPGVRAMNARGGWFAPPTVTGMEQELRRLWQEAQEWNDA